MKTKSILCCLLLAVAANLFTTAKAQVNTTDSLALVDLYNSTNGPGWDAHTNWLTTAPVSTWWGITVTNNRVTVIHLQGDNLHGTLPSSIGNIVKLDTLNLFANHLKGRIPTSIGNLTSLGYLSLSGKLIGGIPDTIGNLTNLTFLQIDETTLGGTIPSSIGNLTKLTYLELEANELGGSIPASIGNLVNLTNLNLQSNQLTGTIPSTLGNCTNLTLLTLESNQLTGTIPAEIGNLTNLTGLILESNQLTGTIHSNITKLVNLSYLSLSYNKLRGTIPFNIGNLVNLTFLYLSNNALSGSIPASISKLANLYMLDLSSNHLSGSIPSSISKLTHLASLELDFNELTQETNVSFPDVPEQTIIVSLVYNRFTFNGLEFVAKKFPYTTYGSQANIPVHQQGNTLSVYAGGTLGNNTYYWFKGNVLAATIKGDSTFQPAESGKYFVHVKNAVATQLTLSSDTIDFAINNLTAASRVAANVSNTHFVVYPNPATNLIHIQTTGTATIILTNSAGKVLLTKTIHNSDVINVSGFANGTYYIQNKTIGETQKVIVVH